MRRGEYIQTPEGQRNLLLKRRLNRYVFSPVFQEPKSKNSITHAEKVAFQQSLLADIAAHKRKYFRAPVALQFDFTPTLRNAPAIHTLAKNYIDLLQLPVTGLTTGRKRLILQDDRQVRYLAVKYHVSTPSQNPEIALQAVPYRDLLDDVALLDRIEHDDFIDGEQSFDYDEYEEERSGRRFDDDAVEELNEWESERNSWIRTLGQKAYEWWHEMLTIKAQEQALHTFSPRPTSLCTLLAPLHARPRVFPDLENILQGTRDMMISPPLAIDLHHSDLKPGESSKFKRLVESALETFRGKYRRLFPLKVAMGVTILFQPPARGGIDLDNLARRIVPFVNEKFAPPTSRFRNFDPNSVRDSKLRAQFQRDHAALKNLPAHSVTFYEVIQLPRLSNDTQQGFVRLLLSEGAVPVTLWEKVNHISSAWEDSF